MARPMLASLRAAVLLTFLTGAFAAGCDWASASSPVAAQSDEQLLQSLEDGSANLTKLTITSGYKVAREEAKAIDSFRYAYDSKDWEQLAVQVLRVNSGSDLSWYYLGHAAEELGYLQAAVVYYEKSIEASSKKMVSACIGKVCSGFDFPEDAQTHLAAVRQKLQ